jgi:hypothetical protein
MAVVVARLRVRCVVVVVVVGRRGFFDGTAAGKGTVVAVVGGHPEGRAVEVPVEEKGSS